MTKEEIKEKNIKKVLNEAILCFKEYGVENTTIHILSKRTGLTTRSINRYFGSKNELIIKASEIFLSEVFDKMRITFHQVCSNQCTGIKQIEIYLNVQHNLFSNDFSNIYLLSEMERHFYAHYEKDPTAQELLHRYFLQNNECENILSQALTTGINDGTIRPDITIPIMSRMIYISFVAFSRRLMFCREEGITNQEIYEQYKLFTNIIKNYLVIF